MCLTEQLTRLSLLKIMDTRLMPIMFIQRYAPTIDATMEEVDWFSFYFEKKNGLVREKYSAFLLSGPGISSYSNAVENASVPLKHCMDSAKEIVPQGKHQETPVYLGATAGMRLLRYLRKSSYTFFMFCRDELRENRLLKFIWIGRDRNFSSVSMRCLYFASPLFVYLVTCECISLLTV